MRSTWLSVKYANMLGMYVDGFKVKKTNPYLANCRCPICGDSQKSKTKARGYIFQINDILRYSCKNCGASLTFFHFLKLQAPTLYDEYRLEMYKESEDVRPPIEIVMTPLMKPYQLKLLQTVAMVDDDHPVKQYVLSRKIPEKWHDKLYVSEKYTEFVNTFIPGKLDEKYNEPRLVIPFLTREGDLQGFSGRSMTANTPAAKKYITINLAKERECLFGLDTVDPRKTVYIVEGPIDSMFLENSIAMSKSSFKVPEFINDFVVVFDNEPRNKEILREVSKSIRKGYKVCIWPRSIEQKDINEMILAGHDPQRIIKENTFQGLSAEVQFAEWSVIRDILSRH